MDDPILDSSELNENADDDDELAFVKGNTIYKKSYSDSAFAESDFSFWYYAADCHRSASETAFRTGV